MFSQNNPINRFNDKGKHYFTMNGIDWGASLQILRETDHYILAYRKGHTAWICLGTQGYHSPILIIFEKIDNNSVKGFPSLKEFKYTRETRKETYKEVNEFFDELIKKETEFKSAYD